MGDPRRDSAVTGCRGRVAAVGGVDPGDSRPSVALLTRGGTTVRRSRGRSGGGLSDHTWFQAQGYPACVVSEDFFVGPGDDARTHRRTRTPTGPGTRSSM